MNTENFKIILSDRRVQLGGVALLSAAAGGFSGYKFAQIKLREHYVDISNQEIAAAKEFYRQLHKADDYDTPEKVLTKRHGQEASEALKSYQGDEVEVVVEVEEIVEEVPIEEKPDLIEVHRNIFSNAQPIPDETDVFDYEAELARRDSTSPYIISHDEYFENELDYDQTAVTYYEKDDVLVDERDQPIPDVEMAVGEDNLTRFGHGSKDRNIVYIRNEKLELDFEIVKNSGSFSEQVLGFLEHSDEPRIRKFRNRDD